MKKIKNLLLIVLFFGALYPQWAMWANPSLPVGGSDTGIGLGVGEVMVFGDFAYQYFDWWHEQIESYKPGTSEGENNVMFSPLINRVYINLLICTP